MANNEKRRIPVREGLWTTPSSPDEKPHLIGSQCLSCGELFFPKMEKGICTHCQSRSLKDVKLGLRGKIYSFSTVMQRPPKFFLGEVPYSYGYVELPEGIRIQSMFTGCDPEELEIGMDVELVIEKLGEDEQGNEVMAHKFGPVKAYNK